MNDTCICESGFIGYGDFVSGHPSCQISIAAVKALWSILAIVHFLTLIVCAVFFYKKLKRRHKFDKNFRGVVYCTLGSIFLFGLGILRAFSL